MLELFKDLYLFAQAGGKVSPYIKNVEEVLSASPNGAQDAQLVLEINRVYFGSLPSSICLPQVRAVIRNIDGYSSADQLALSHFVPV